MWCRCPNIAVQEAEESDGEDEDEAKENKSEKGKEPAKTHTFKKNKVMLFRQSFFWRSNISCRNKVNNIFYKKRTFWTGHSMTFEETVVEW